MVFFSRNSDHLPDFWKKYEAGFRESAKDSLEEVTFAGLDTETTGFDLSRDRILSIGCLLLQDHKIRVKNVLEIYVKQEHYNYNTAEVHGILKNEGAHCISELEALEQLLKFIQNAVIIGHHTHFDIAMINAALQRHALPSLKNKYLDTSHLYKKTILRSPVVKPKDTYTLDELAVKYDISLKDRHTALGDAYITLIAFLNILKVLKVKGHVNLKSLLRFSR